MGGDSAVGTSRAAAPAANNAPYPLAKLRPPALPADHVVRPRLCDRLDEARGRRLTIVVAGPGYGKTTVLADWAAARGLAWYAIDRRDSSLDHFAAGIAHALGLEDRWDRAGGSGAAPEPLAELICDRLEQTPDDDVVLIVDDVHELDRSGASARFLRTLVRMAPPGLHLVLSSRLDPPFAIERLRGQGQVLTLDSSALAFTEDEFARLLGNHDQAAALHALTAGWPAAVRLTVDAIRQDATFAAGDVLERLAKPEGPLFDYLAEEVFSRAPQGARELLRTGAILDRFTVELCEALGVVRAADTIAQLRRRGLFVQSADGEWYALHALVRQFALERWPLDASELRAIRRRALDWLEAHDRVEDALAVAEGADDDELAAFLIRHGSDLVAWGHAERVLEAAERVGDPDDLELELVRAEAEFNLGDNASARTRVTRIARDHDGLLDARLAFWLAIAYQPFDLRAALRYFERARLDDVGDAELGSGLSYWAIMSAKVGDYVSARQLAGRALRHAEAAKDPRALSDAYNALGVVASATGEPPREHLYRTAARHASEPRSYQGTIARSNANLADALVELGRWDEAMQAIEEALSDAERSRRGPVVARCLGARAHVWLRSGRLDEALRDQQAALEILQATGAPADDSTQLIAADAHRERGDLAQARAAYEQVIEGSERSGFRALIQQGLAGLGRIVVGDDPARAVALSRRAVDLGVCAGYADAALASAWVALAADDRARALDLADRAAGLAEAGGLVPVQAESLVLRAMCGPELAYLEEALQLWRELGNPLETAKCEYALARLRDPPDPRGAARARRKLRELGVRDGALGAAGLLMALGPDSPPLLEIQALGGFRVLRRGVAVRASEWRSKKARDLLKLLVARTGRAVPRDVAMEALWPDEDPQKTGNRLSVALSTLRGALDPDHEHPPEHFLGSARDAIVLEPGRIVVDSDGFLADASAGLAAARDGRTGHALELLEAAEAAYTGEFLEGDLYEDWAAAPREELRAMYIEVARTLADLAPDPHVSARYLRRIVEREPYDEQVHLDLVGRLLAARAHGESRRAYRAYTARMEEIGVEPAPFPRTTLSRL